MTIRMEHLWNITGRIAQQKCGVHRNPVSTLTGTVLLFITKTNQLMVFRGIVGVYYKIYATVRDYRQHTNTSCIKFQRFLKAELGCKRLRLFVRFMTPFGFISGYQRLGETCCLSFPQSRWVTAGSSETLAIDTKVTIAF
jgi:hypothetical protein